MVKKLLFISLALFGLLFSGMVEECFADASAQFQQAETYKKKGQYEQAESIYKQIVTDYPGTDDALQAQRKLTTLYIALNKQTQADASFNKLVTSFAGNVGIAKAVHDVGFQCRRLKKYDKANQYYQYVLDNWPDGEQAIWSQKDIAKLNVERGDIEAAQAATGKLLADYSEDNRLAEALCSIGDAYRESDRDKDAIELYQNVVDNWPQHQQVIRALKNITKSNIALGNDPNAEAATEKLLTDFSTDKGLPAALRSIADTYRYSHRHQKAVELYQYILEHWPDDEGAIHLQKGIAKSELQLGDDPNAEADTEKLLGDFSEQQDLPAAIRSIADSYRYSRRYQKARQLYQHILDSWPEAEGAIHVYKGLAMANIWLADDPNAADAIERLLADFNDHIDLPAVVCQIADSYLDVGRYEKAEQYYQLALDERPDDKGTIHSREGIVLSNISLYALYGIGDPNVQAEIDRLFVDFNDHPDLPSTIFRIGEEYYNKARYIRSDPNLPGAEVKDNFQKAISVWERVITELPACAAYTPRFYYVTAVVYSQELHEYQKGIEYYQQIVANWPDYEFAWHAQYFVGMYYERLLKSGGIEKSEALPKIEQAYIAVVENYPDSKSAPHAALYLGRIDFNRKQWVEAAYYFELFLQKSDNNQALRYVVSPLGQAYEKMGQADSAIAVYREFISTAEPTDPLVQTIAARLEKLEGATK